MPTRGWVLTRIEFAVAITVILVTTVLLLDWLAPTFGSSEEWKPMALLLLGGIGLLGMFVGLVWMIRIYRGPRDQSPRWRFRDR